jgi:hypothetical protein
VLFFDFLGAALDKIWSKLVEVEHCEQALTFENDGLKKRLGECAYYT